MGIPRDRGMEKAGFFYSDFLEVNLTRLKP